MRWLHHLIQTLTKDEKRLYHRRRTNARVEAIYENYTKASLFSRDLDKEIFERHYSDNTRAFYSILKRELADEILTALFSSTHENDPLYAYTRASAKALLLLHRQNFEGAQTYLDEASTQADTLGDLDLRVLTKSLEKRLAPELEDTSLDSLEALLRQEETLKVRELNFRAIQNTHVVHQFLKLNRHTLPAETVRQRSQLLLNELLPFAPHKHDVEVFLESLGVGIEVSWLAGDPERYHLALLDFYKQLPAGTPASVSIRLVNLLLESALLSGDFLLLSSLIYKTNKELPALQTSLGPSHLWSYHESCALYYFYENDLPQAQRKLEEVLGQPGLSYAQRLRCSYYRLAMLLAAYLPDKAENELRRYQKQYPDLLAHPVLWIVELMAEIELGRSPDLVMLKAGRYQAEAKRRKLHKAFGQVYLLLQQFAEGDKRAPKALSPDYIPLGWQPILRADLWVQAKLKNRFYYNLLMDDWSARKRVF